MFLNIVLIIESRFLFNSPLFNSNLGLNTPNYHKSILITGAFKSVILKSVVKSLFYQNAQRASSISIVVIKPAETRYKSFIA